MYINGPDGLDQQVVRIHGLGGVHPPDPLHLVAGVQRFRNALSICHLFYYPKKKLLRLSVNIRETGVQFAAGQVAVSNQFILQPGAGIDTVRTTANNIIPLFN